MGAVESCADNTGIADCVHGVHKGERAHGINTERVVHKQVAKLPRGGPLRPSNLESKEGGDHDAITQRLCAYAELDDANGVSLLCTFMGASQHINNLNYHGVAPLHVAARAGSTATFRELLVRGADPDMRAWDGRRFEDFLRANDACSEAILDIGTTHRRNRRDFQSKSSSTTAPSTPGEGYTAFSTSQSSTNTSPSIYMSPGAGESERYPSTRSTSSIAELSNSPNRATTFHTPNGSMAASLARLTEASPYEEAGAGPNQGTSKVRRAFNPSDYSPEKLPAARLPGQSPSEYLLSVSASQRRDGNVGSPPKEGFQRGYQPAYHQGEVASRKQPQASPSPGSSQGILESYAAHSHNADSTPTPPPAPAFLPAAAPAIVPQRSQLGSVDAPPSAPAEPPSWLSSSHEASPQATHSPVMTQVMTPHPASPSKRKKSTVDAFAIPEDDEYSGPPLYHDDGQEEVLSDGSIKKVVMVERRNATWMVSLVQGKAGIGVSLGSTATGETYVTGLAPGGPAEACGKIVKGDQILAIDRVRVQGLDVSQTVKLVMGVEGTIVRLDIKSAPPLYPQQSSNRKACGVSPSDVETGTNQ